MSTLAPPQPIVAVRVYGHPAPQGSKRHVGKGIMVESSKHVRPWREAVKAAVLQARPPVGLVDAPVIVWVDFMIDRPKSHYRTGRNSRLLRESAPKVPGSKPDLDKLLRSTLDALADAYVFRDDSQIVGIDANKVYASVQRGAPGADITVWEWREAT